MHRILSLLLLVCAVLAQDIVPQDLQVELPKTSGSVSQPPKVTIIPLTTAAYETIELFQLQIDSKTVLQVICAEHSQEWARQHPDVTITQVWIQRGRVNTQGQTASTRTTLTLVYRYP